jgi:hypothetical protein
VFSNLVSRIQLSMDMDRPSHTYILVTNSSFHFKSSFMHFYFFYVHVHFFKKLLNVKNEISTL